MKKLITILALLVFATGVNAQTTIYMQTFNGTYTDWTLNTSDLGGVGVSPSDNQWIVNNVYMGGTGIITVPATADEPSGITGYPESYYLHIYNAEDPIYGVPDNCNFLAGGSSTYFAAMNTAIVTTGYSGVSFSFWWLCNGDAGAYGKVYYRTSVGGTWTAIPGGPSTYYGSSVWAQQIVTNPAFDGQAFLEFGFQFKEDLTGNDPGFAVDEIKVTGTPSSGAPVAAFTESATTTCQDSCITFTNTSTGSATSYVWDCSSGYMSTLTTAAPVTVCFSVAGVYTMSLTAFGSTTSTATHTVTINPTPHPVITWTGHTLHVAGTYSAYQWLTGTTPIVGATTSSYTFTSSGLYSVGVDSGGCWGWDTLTASTLYVNNIVEAPNKFWITQSQSGAVNIFAVQPLSDELDINIYDPAGRRITGDTWDKGSIAKQVRTADLPPGIYIIRLTNKNTAQVLRWIKQ